MRQKDIILNLFQGVWLGGNNFTHPFKRIPSFDIVGFVHQ